MAASLSRSSSEATLAHAVRPLALLGSALRMRPADRSHVGRVSSVASAFRNRTAMHPLGWAHGARSLSLTWRGGPR